MPQAISYDDLYFFSAQGAALVEVKVTSMAADAPPDQVYHWLYADERELQKLVFKSMRGEGGRNFRGEYRHADYRPPRTSCRPTQSPLATERAVATIARIAWPSAIGSPEPPS